MVFSSIEFIFYFLPVTLLAYFLCPRAVRNIVLLLFSLVFYAWGELQFLWVMLVSIAMNYAFALFIRGDRSVHDKWAVGFAVTGNIVLLVVFKYANFLISDVLNLDWVVAIRLPLGISFFTFQAMSYIVDVYRGDARVERNILNVGLYISLFPQLIAGPIVRFNLIADELHQRNTSLDGFVAGMRLFVIGLAQKVLIANAVAPVADAVFETDPAMLRVETAWLGVACYTIQIFFDFSGYSLMAIGLGRVFGFSFPQNFNYPYISRSITEFWRRWHITLSTWFRDYLYIPLGGNRDGAGRTYLNLLIVFVLCGLWHGAAWTFVFWGLYHGGFLVIERLGFSRLLATIWSPLQHIYLLVVVMVGWTLFRADNLDAALALCGRMVGIGGGASVIRLDEFMTVDLLVVLVAAVVFSTPWPGRLFEALGRGETPLGFNFGQLSQSLIVIALILLATAKLMAGAYNPFIYFRF